MTPEERLQLDQLQEKTQQLRSEVERFKAGGTFPYDVEQAIRDRLRVPYKLGRAPRAAITAPIGGATQDAQARTAINSIITALEELGLLVEN